ncbi:MAG: glycosyltransferase family 4 protein [Planctomycetes bacterium]|nr:glycosyltransferase family 4 protein [Planctomycetota bacterium]
MSELHVALGVLCGVTGGPASYGIRLAQALVALADAPRLTIVTDRPERFASIGCDVVALPMRGGVDRLRWQHLALPAALRRIAPTIYHDTKNALPRGLRVPAVVTVHDLAYHVMPETFGLASRLFLRRATRDAVRRSACIVVPSLATAADVARFHPDCQARVHVVYHGIDAPAPVAPERLAAVRTRLALPERYVLHVGTIQQRKNVDVLVRAVRAARTELPDLRVVLAGRRGWRSEAAFAEIAADDTAHWLGEVAQDDLQALYAGATLFGSPSGYEGFGLAVADALAAGVPTLAAAAGSLPELCGDAAVLLPPADVSVWSRAIIELVGDPARRARLAQSGRQRANEFTWERAAADTLTAYRLARGGAQASTSVPRLTSGHVGPGR